MDTKGHETIANKKDYHTPELTLLGPIRSVVNGGPGSLGDGCVTPAGSFTSCS